MPTYEYDREYPFAAFITNLGKYNEGELIGEWVKFPTTAEEIKAAMDSIGIGQKDDFGYTYEEWFITDYDCYVDGLYDKLGEYVNLDELNYLASKLDEMSQSEYEQFQAAMSVGDHGGSLQDMINLTENLDCYEVNPNITDYDDLGRYYIDELEAMQIPDYLQNCIDYKDILLINQVNYHPSRGDVVLIDISKKPIGGEYTSTSFIRRSANAESAF